MIDGDQGCHDLDDEFQPGRQRHDVVDDAHDDDDHRAQQDALHHPADIGKQHDAEDEAQKYGQAAQARIGVLCIRRPSFGTSMAPTRWAKDLTIGVEAKLMTNAAATAKPTCTNKLVSISVPTTI